MADNFTFLDASSNTRTAQAQDNGGVHLPATVLAASDGTLVGADDAAAAGPIFPAGGIYQATVDEVDAGDIGRLRMSARRGLITLRDYRAIFANQVDVSAAGDLEVSTTGQSSGYGAPTTAFFDGADAGFGSGARYMRLPMAGWAEIGLSIYNALAVNITLELFAWLYGVNAAGDYNGKLYSATLTAGGIAVFATGAGGTGAANMVQVATLSMPMTYLVVGVTPASDPSTGSIRIYANRRA